MPSVAKFLTALAGVALILTGQWAGYNTPLYTDLVAIFAALGVWAVPNGK